MLLLLLLLYLLLLLCYQKVTVWLGLGAKPT